MGTHVHKPEDIYRQVNRVAPDLVIIFGDLRWRSVGSVGNPDIYTFDNDTGPDDANHAQEGMYILAHPTLAGRGRMDDATLYDVTPTTLKLLGQSVPTDMRGKCLV
jgi:predicted AlkP superfamily phosphohydrolase/phosphomutase